MATETTEAAAQHSYHVLFHSEEERSKGKGGGQGLEGKYVQVFSSSY